MSSRNNLSHRRTHNLLLISKLLSLRDTASPLTLILDSLEQPAKPLLKEYIRRGQLSKTHITFISFESLKKPNGVDSFIFARRKKPADLAKEVAAVAPSSSSGPARRRLIIVDAVNPLLSKSEIHLPSYLSSLIAPSNAAAPTQTSMVVTYHHDVVGIKNRQPYVPSDLTLLSYLGTTILTIHSLSHILAQKDARDRSLAAPVFGLEEEQEGVLVGRHDQEHSEGIVIEMEHRRKSGRGVVEWYFLPPASSYQPQELREVVTLLDDHPLYQRPEDDVPLEEEPGSTFELKLTERQRRDREGVVLPYFDAQKGDGPGEGGRILYDMGEEDDFDEEEDEI